MRRLGNLGRLIVANMRIKSCNQHERLVHDLGNAVRVRLNTLHAVLTKSHAAIGCEKRDLGHLGLWMSSGYSPNRRMERSTLDTMSGLNTFNSKCPVAPPIVTAT